MMVFYRQWKESLGIPLKENKDIVMSSGKVN